MTGDKKIILAGVALLVVGIGKAAVDKKPIDKPLVGGLVAILLLSSIGLFGQDASNFAGDLALLALATALVVDGPELLQASQKIQGPKGSSGAQGQSTNTGNINSPFGQGSSKGGTL